jgi:Tol biopolymer transport system component/tRNA A-37 threonylcarbamoyl transferase component Bud32
VIGTLLNHYRVTKLIGAGAMGEVYAADDTELQREVAIKVLPPELVDDPDRRKRFEREAHAIAALNHPNIVTIHSIEQSGDRLFLTMELVRGQPLAALIPARGLPLPRLLKLAVPLADAISAAHDKGVIHRDLKPSNVMITDDDRVKVLDFGLARLTGPAFGDAGLTALTMSGAGHAPPLGTAAYMSPEQANGRAVDARSDIFSLGIVLYEAATGRRPFEGDTPLSVLSSIVKDAPAPLTNVNAALPTELARIVRRCLAKDPARRYQTAADVRNDLAELAEDLAAGRGAPAQPAAPRKRFAAAAALIVTALVGAAGWMLALQRDATVPTADVLSVLPAQDTMLTEGEAPVLSPDGAMLAFVATDSSGRTLLYVRERGSLASRALPETDDAAQPFWAPDGRSLGFFARAELKTVAVEGGRPRMLASAPVPRGGTWSREDLILFVPFPEDPPLRVSASGGAVETIAVPPGEWRWFPSFLPDGRHYLYTRFDLRGGPSGIFVASLDDSENTQLLPWRSPGVYVEPGYLLFQRERAIVAQPYDARTRVLSGDEVTVAENVGTNLATRLAQFSVANDGSLAYIDGTQDWELSWFDRSGRGLGAAARLGAFNSLCVSADGRHVVHDVTEGARSNLWSIDLSDDTRTRLTFSQASDFYVVCSRQGREVVFASTRLGTPNLYRLLPEAPGSEQPLPPSMLPSLPTHWSADGRFVLYSAYSRATSWDIWVQPLEGGEAYAFLATAAEEKNAHLSPNGRWLSYTSNEGGAEQVYVQPFPATGPRWQISSGGGRQPQWRHDGTQLYYVGLDKQLRVVDVDGTAATFVHGAPRVLINTPVRGAEMERTHQGNPYVVSPDGERFLIADTYGSRPSITVVRNWLALAEGRR